MLGLGRTDFLSMGFEKFIAGGTTYDFTTLTDGQTMPLPDQADPISDRKRSRLWLRRWQFLVRSWGCLPIPLLSTIKLGS